MPFDPRALYDSGFHHPLAAYLTGLALLVALARRLSFVHGYVLLFTVEILADALVTGAWSPVASSSPWFTPLSILFVILGDLRVFLLAEKLARPERSVARALAAALPISLLVPVITGVGSRVVPALADSRTMFFVYEVLLFALVLGLGHGLYARRAASPEAARAVRRIVGFVAVQYAGWALADAVLLAGQPLGHLLRIVPNVLYYAAYMPFVWVTLVPSKEAAG